MIVDSRELANEVLRVIHISKLQSAYRVRVRADKQGLEWLTTDGEKEIVLTEEPDSTFLRRMQNFLLTPFVREDQL